MTGPGDPHLQRRRRQALARQARRRRLGLGALAVTAAGVGAWLGARGNTESDRSESAAASSARPECPARIATDPRRLAGQMLMVRFDGTATPELLRAARRGEIGGVIVFPRSGLPEATVRGAIARLQRASREGGNPPLVVATDQEGGDVKRFAEGPPRSSPPELASAGADAAQAEGRATGRYLRELGINVDLAPVLDLGVTESFVASRTFGADPASVATLGVAFAEGLEEAGVAATAKHFPGLGRATANTDLGQSVVERSRRELAPGLEPFRAAVGATVPLVMTSNATYPAYDAERPASLSAVITRLLRSELGFNGVVITDDLLAGGIAGAGYAPAEAAVAAARAGADLLLFARLTAPEALPALVAAQRRGTLDPNALRGSCARNLALRQSLGG